MSTASLKEVEVQLANLQALVAKAQDNRASELESQCVHAARIAQQLRNITKPPGEIAHEITMMPYITTATRLAIDLGIFKSLSAACPKHQTSQDLADYALANTDAKAVSPDFIARTMRLLTLYGLAIESDYGTHVANSTTHAFAAPDEAMQSLVVHFFEFYNPALEHSVSYFAEQGYVFPTEDSVGPFQSFWQVDIPTYEFWLRQPPVVLERLNKFMKAVHSVAWYEWIDVGEMFKKRIEEVGGGHDKERLLLVDLVKGRIALEERPPVIKDALAAAAGLGYSEKTGMAGVDYVAHNFLELQPTETQGSLYYYLSYVLHNWNDETSIRLLKQVAKAVRPGYSRLLINERVLQPTGNDLQKSGLDFHMAFSHGSKERTLAEYGELVKAAGMEVIKYHRSPDDGQDLVECALS
ncbi:hypothetical protein M409DRAFT_28526 [Zasmidium cellare ATCC 36951]|uniref:O-methyltransferase C-terminal domain-containing protein n=1 Tax=Zasmidium cellare ATCC 36951 TaxID=1080233 RepID=A0A6A6C268_ZASCE|nr:uncharacterized protein M409DRAFT_28526 [Zasmidium cellare ATCC 36951]KAF2161197.1 hypothetical protein M409DRAFT_28526 [Zasmidium cellare ATCC 36951]